MGVEGVVDGAVVGAVAVALVAFRRTAECPVPGPGRRGPSPEAALALVTGLIFLNQVLFTVYVLRVHDGDPSFIARHLPPGWFEPADGAGPLRWLADHFPAPELLAPSVLRVQAFLELPFVLLAFLSVLRWLDPGLYGRVLRAPVLLWSASVAYTWVFCVVEWDLRNPYTEDDLVVPRARRCC
ncbi:hypothetical protein [Streptomyces sp. JJ36]|uniref:hypothetical protein n=1 Tax=Streptomyces sp. JJ36 TaxID=2736645 RepID=UPI001F1F3C56|nr:hypothetical protein [Streptomyces sp. JJ36]MCF6525017.1 hypothetical protein [Streptomyces sp. JJ36]